MNNIVRESRVAYSLSSARFAHDFRGYLSALCAVTMSVTLVFACMIQLDTLARSLDRGSDAVSGVGGVSLVSASRAQRLSPNDLTTVAGLKGVQSVLPINTFSSIVKSQSHDEKVNVSGLPPEAATVSSMKVFSGRLPSPGKAELLMPKALAQELQVGLDDEVSVNSPSGHVGATVVGIYRQSDLTFFSGGNLFTSLAFSWQAAGSRKTFTRFDVVLESSVDSIEWVENNKQTFPAGVKVYDSSTASQGMRTIANIVVTVMALMCIASFCLALFLSFIAFSHTLRRRTREDGTLRALGASASTVKRSIYFEALLVGFLSSVLGILLGLALSHLLCDLMNRTGIFSASSVALKASYFVAALAVGAFGPVCAVAAISRKYYRLSIPALMRFTSHTQQPMHRATYILSSIVLAVLLSCLVISSPTFKILGLLCALGASFVFAILVVRLVTTLSSRLDWTFALARHNIVNQPFASFSIGLSGAVVFIGLLLTGGTLLVHNSVVANVSTQFGAPIQATAPFVDTDDYSQQLRETDGVSVVSAGRWGIVDIKSSTKSMSQIDAISINPSDYFAVSDLTWDKAPVHGRGSVPEQAAVVLPRSLALDLSVSVGDAVTLSAKGESIQVNVAGTYTSLATGSAPYVTRDVSQLLQFDGRARWDIGVKDDSEVSRVEDAVRKVLQSAPGAKVTSSEEMRSLASKQVTGFLGGSVVIVVLVLIASMVALGGVHSLAVHNRVADVAVLRAVGSSKRKLAVLIAKEQSQVAITAALVGAALGSLGMMLLSELLSSALNVDLARTVHPLVYVLVFFLFFTAFFLSVSSLTRQINKVSPATALKGT